MGIDPLTPWSLELVAGKTARPAGLLKGLSHEMESGIKVASIKSSSVNAVTSDEKTCFY